MRKEHCHIRSTVKCLAHFWFVDTVARSVPQAKLGCTATAKLGRMMWHVHQTSGASRIRERYGYQDRRPDPNHGQCLLASLSNPRAPSKRTRPSDGLLVPYWQLQVLYCVVRGFLMPRFFRRDGPVAPKWECVTRVLLKMVDPAICFVGYSQ